MHIKSFLSYPLPPVALEHIAMCLRSFIEQREHLWLQRKLADHEYNMHKVKFKPACLELYTCIYVFVYTLGIQVLVCKENRFMYVCATIHVGQFRRFV